MMFRPARHRSRFTLGTGLFALLAGGLIVLSVPASARDADELDGRFDSTHTLIGSYLAGRFAKSEHEIEQSADFYNSALIHDPNNAVLVEQAFLMELSAGNFSQASVLAGKLVKLQPQHRLAQLFLGLEAFKNGKPQSAEKHFKTAGSGPIGELTASLMRAWVTRSNGSVTRALALLDRPKQADWAQYYLRYHRALIADSAGRTKTARSAYKDVFKQDSRTLRTTLAFARHAAHAGDRKLALSVLREYDRNLGTDSHPLSEQLRLLIESGKPVPLLVSKPTAGMAEVLYGLGEALTTEGGVSIGIVYLQMSLYLAPGQPLALAALAQAYETTKNHAKAIATYDRIEKDTPLQDAIDIRKAFNLNLENRTDEAKALLLEVAKRSPKDLAPLDALGNILRARKRYDEAIIYYSRALKLIGNPPQKRHWAFFYSRGTCYERTKQWAKAEKDLKQALALAPQQPLALNYLGYSWIDQGRNLREGLKLIKKAVSLKPDDGYIVDSLGWAYYRLGRYDDAVTQLERAVELRPDDPVLNDHLGDALWRVGREREARFQWDQALSLEPEPAEVVKIKKKLAEGLSPPATAKLRRSQAASTERQRMKKVEGAPNAVR
ncbi:MAG: tetratricopeptide repeat protein [Hyphomicrobiaceae bacterium]|nr:tetratricopeptide repeat protein [Hyphomicrobiaceae bacterium]MCC0009081.1 tetratricopeptide repeat protein [Hyphomicrobiaceae bacterium]